MGKLVLHQVSLSAPCRSVRLVADVLGLELDVKTCDIKNREHLSPEYLKLNSHHTVPTLDDDGFVLYESRAIITYLVDKYAPNSSLYPQDLKKRALVDQALQFDGTTLYPTMGLVIYPIIKLGSKLDKESAKMLDEKLTLLNEDLGRTPFIAGNELTVADLSLLITWTSTEATGVWETKHLKNIHAWVKRVKDTGKIKKWKELIEDPSKECNQIVTEKLKSN